MLKRYECTVKHQGAKDVERIKGRRLMEVLHRLRSIRVGIVKPTLLDMPTVAVEWATITEYKLTLVGWVPVSQVRLSMEADCLMLIHGTRRMSW